MIINLWCIKIDTNNSWAPVIISDVGVNVFFLLLALANLGMIPLSYFYFGWGWIILHALCFVFSVWWPYMIAKGYTHKGLSHASYGLLTMLPHLVPMQIWGFCFLVDKILNWNTLTWPGGKKVLRSEPAPDGKSNFWTDRDPSTMLVENFPAPKCNQGYPFFVGFAFYPFCMIAYSICDLLLNLFSKKIPYLLWIRVAGNGVYAFWCWWSLHWLYNHPIR